MKAESKLWQKVKKNTPNILWTRVESWASFGFPDLVGYTEKRGFFTVELKVTKSNKVTFSPHQIAFHYKHPKGSYILVKTLAPRAIKLYPGSAIKELVAYGPTRPPACPTDPASGPVFAKNADYMDTPWPLEFNSHRPGRSPQEMVPLWHHQQ